MFRAAAEAETTHAHAHLAAMEGIGSTLQNLEDAVKGETYEHTTMYPPMKEQADREGHRARTMFGWAMEAEAVHARLYQMALEAVKAGKDIEAMEIWICPVCGDIHLGKPTEKCGICGAAASKYVQMS